MKITPKPLKMGLITAVIASLLLFSAIPGPSAETLVYSKDSLYHRIMVYDNGPTRALRFGMGANAVNQSMIDTRDLHRLLLDYTRLAFAGLLLNPSPKKALIIGLGGGVIPHKLHHHFPDAEIDIVDIDLEVVRVAKDFFFFEADKNVRIHLSDGRVFIRRLAARGVGTLYDLIILDAFNSEYIPFHLTTREFLKQVSAILDPRGVVVANVFRNNQLFDAELQTFRAVYGRCYVFSGTESTNAILVSPGTDLPDLVPKSALSRADRLQKRHAFSFDLNGVARQFRSGFLPRSDARVLTDDRAPVNILRHRSR